MQFKLHYFIGDREFVIDTRHLEEELAAYFPEKREQLARFFALIERMNGEAMRGGRRARRGRDRLDGRTIPAVARPSAGGSGRES